MSSQHQKRRSVTLRAENIGGIDETAVEFGPGVTVLEGRNATNRTSLLQAIMAGCGSTDVSIKADAEEAVVEVTVDGETYQRTLRRENGTVVADGEGYLDDPELAGLFAFLLESNEARRAVVTGQDLRELIMRPVDTTAIQTEITRLEARKDQLDERLSEIDEAKTERQDLTARRRQLKTEIDDTEAELDAIKTELGEAENSVESRQADQEALENKLSELRDRREELEEIRYARDTELESIDALREEHDSVEAELEDVSAVADTDPDAVEAEIDDLRKKRQQLERRVTELNTVIQFNEEMLDGSDQHLQAVLQGEEESDAEAVTDRLLHGEETVTCWTCGSSVTTDRIEETLELLQDVRSETVSEVADLADDVEERQEEYERYREQRQRRAELEGRLEEVEAEIADRETNVDDLDERRETLVESIESLEADVAELRSDARSELLDTHERANELEFELDRLRGELETVEEEIAVAESQIEEEDSLRDQREEVQSELKRYRTRIERIQEQAAEAFNDHMERILELLEYDNIGRVWIEHVEATVSSGRGQETKPAFDLRVVRDPDEGAAYRDSVDNLSESEREVVGLVFALAGFLVHGAEDECPFILLDSLEAFDAERIDTLLSYLEDHCEYLVTALLPEDAAAVTGDCAHIRDI